MQITRVLSFVVSSNRGTLLPCLPVQIFTLSRAFRERSAFLKMCIWNTSTINPGSAQVNAHVDLALTGCFVVSCASAFLLDTNNSRSCTYSEPWFGGHLTWFMSRCVSWWHIIDLLIWTEVEPLNVATVAPELRALHPDRGPLEGGTSLTIAGSGFSPYCRLEVRNILFKKIRVPRTQIYSALSHLIFLLRMNWT